MRVEQAGELGLRHPFIFDDQGPIPAWLNTIMNGIPSSETTAEAKIDYFLGAIFDEDAVLTDMQVEKARTSGIEARNGRDSRTADAVGRNESQLG